MLPYPHQSECDNAEGGVREEVNVEVVETEDPPGQMETSLQDLMITSLTPWLDTGEQ
jgi:hypothetical protein